MSDTVPPLRRWLGNQWVWVGGALLVFGLGGAIVLRQVKPARLGALRQTLDGRPLVSRTWTNIDARYWQLASSVREDRAVTDAAEGTRGPCGAGMVHVAGNFLLDVAGSEAGAGIERLQDDTCSRWIDREYPARCATFERDKWLAASKELPRKPMDFCIDRFEYPNLRGQNPYVVVTYREASSMCSAEGKHLCSEAEWTFACEGEEGTPYPNGYERDPDTCVMDRPWRAWNEHVYAKRDGEALREELDRLWQAEPSGTRAACKSSFGVYDMTGNVDEWTRSVRKEGLQSILKGGYWGPVRTRCRPSTRSHGDTFVAYQQGFRCCADVGALTAPTAGGVPAAAPAAAPSSVLDAGAEDAEGPPGDEPDGRDEPIAVAAEANGSALQAIEDDELAALSRRRLAGRCAAAPGGAGEPIPLGVAAAACLAAASRRARGAGARRSAREARLRARR
jgi:sulfatase modifying factor 1